jgi:hypothetical protein
MWRLSAHSLTTNSTRFGGVFTTRERYLRLLARICNQWPDRA